MNDESKAPRVYRDIDVKECSLLRLCRQEPEYAVNRIDQLETELVEANRRVAEVEADINIIYVAVVKYVEAATAMIAALKELKDA